MLPYISVSFRHTFRTQTNAYGPGSHQNTIEYNNEVIQYTSVYPFDLGTFSSSQCIFSIWNPCYWGVHDADVKIVFPANGSVWQYFLVVEAADYFSFITVCNLSPRQYQRKAGKLVFCSGQSCSFQDCCGDPNRRVCLGFKNKLNTVVARSANLLWCSLVAVLRLSRFVTNGSFSRRHCKSYCFP